MYVCHSHNLTRPIVEQKRFGIRMRLPPGDTFARILGEDWQKERWYASPEERDRAGEELQSRHLYSRQGDWPTLVIEKIER